MNYFNKIKNVNPNILIIGDVMIDKYIYCDINNYSKETNIPILNITDTEYCLGGASNVCNNIKKLNYNCTLYSVIGNDAYGQKLKDLLDNNNIDYILESDKDRITTVKTRLYANKKQQCRFDSEVKNFINSNLEELLIQKISKNISKYNSIIISDYGKGVITTNLSQNIIKMANQNNINCIIDSKTTDINKLLECTMFKPNRLEFENLTNITISNLNQNELYSIIRKFTLSIKSKYLLLTLDKDGFILYNSVKDDFINIKTSQNDSNIYINNTLGVLIDTCGAGDTVISIISLLLLLSDFENNKIEYLKFIELCVDCIIHKIGTSYIDVYDIITIQRSINNVINENELIEFSNYLKSINKNIIFTNGCFDILHRGHIEFLKNCKQKADILILGLNSDNSVKLNKGQERPIIPLKDRIYNINALNIADFIITFTEKTPYNIIKVLKPNILAKGDKDYTPDKIIGNEYADKTIVVSTKEYFDTTTIIETIRNYK